MTDIHDGLRFPAFVPVIVCVFRARPRGFGLASMDISQLLVTVDGNDELTDWRMRYDDMG